VGVVGALGLLGMLAAAVALRDLNAVKTDLTSARQAMKRLVDDPTVLRTPEGRAAAIAGMDTILGSIARARSRTAQSVPITVAKVVPGVGAQRSGLLTLVDDVHLAATAGRDLLARADSVAKTVEVKNGAVPVDGIRQLETPVRETGRALGVLARSPAGLWGPLAEARREFDEVARTSSSRLSNGADALGAAQTFMGASGDRRYLIALQNNAEMRDQGMVLSYVVVRFTGSRLVFESNGSVGRLPLDRPAPTPIPPGTEEVFGFIKPTQIWQSVNATADFPFSARAMTDMYQQATRQQINGVIGLDVPALAAMLRVIGPVSVQGVAEPISAASAARILLHDLYEGEPPYSDSIDRRERLGEVTKAVIDRLTSGTTDAVALGLELGEAAKGGHFRLWSQFEEEERVLESTGLGGGPATSNPDRTFHVTVQNRTATKLDYYVKPSVRQEVELTPQGTAIVRTTVVIDNRAPVGAQPSYQLGPDAFTKNPGDYLAWLLLWGPRGSMQRGSVSESGLELSQHVVEVAAGGRREITFETVIPQAVRDGRLELRLVPQARLEPVPLEVRLNAPGWKVDGPLVWQGPWDRVRTVGWDLRR